MALALVASCSGEPSETAHTSSPSPGEPTRQAIAPRPPTRVVPSPGRPIPRSIDGLALELRGLNQAAYAAVDAWLAAGADMSDRPALVVQRSGLRFQEIYRFLTRHPNLAAAVRRRLPAGIAGKVRDHVHAGSLLTRLVTPLEKLPGWKLARPKAPRELRRYFELGERRFGIPWETLAAVNLVETRF
ncbi:MAG TPA: hypothetical protein VHJ82_08885, partial [Actinomycetota bacterium]|nr:hypothetical protein [Actinomycetota bacterium]